jgi:histidine ammonia-lyase
MLERAANSVSEEQLVLWQSGEIVSGSGNLSSVALATHLIALSLQTIGDLSQQRFAPSNATGHANENASSLQARAAAFVAENRERAGSISFDPGGVWRLMPMAGTATLVIAIEILETIRAALPPQSLPHPVGAVVASVRKVAEPESETGAATTSNLAAVGALIGTGTLVAASGLELPSVTPAAPKWGAAPLGGRAKRT